MASITTILGSDNISTSDTVINTNFANLNSDKIETSYLDTDTTLAANSDVKIPSQKAVKAYVDSGGNANASETVRGIVEEATDAEVTAGTATGATGAKLFVTPAKLTTRLGSISDFGDGADGDVTVSGTTTLTSDMYYNNLTVTGTLNTAGYRVFVKGTLSGNGTIQTAPVSGFFLAGGSGGAGGAAPSSGNVGVNGSAPANITSALITTAGNVGGNGGAGSGGAPVGGSGVGGGTATSILTKFGILRTLSLIGCDVSATGALVKVVTSLGGGGGGSGGSDSGASQGGGGNGGSGGGFLAIFANVFGGTMTLNAIGGTGSDGGTRTSTTGGGGGGGAGGNGGYILVIYGTKTWTGTSSVAGGAGGAGGGANGGSDGAAGAAGAVGIFNDVAISELL